MFDKYQTDCQNKPPGRSPFLEIGAPCGVDLLPTTFRVTSCDGASIGEAVSIDGIIEIVKKAPPGRYGIQKETLDFATGDLRSWDWGAITKSRKGRITMDLPPWVD
jgi:hypothetical protein